MLDKNNGCHEFKLFFFQITLQYNLRRAAKARVERMIKPHPKNKHLDAPQYLVDEWKSGDRNALADLLQKVNWDKDSDCMHDVYMYNLSYQHFDVLGMSFSAHTWLEVA